MTDKQRTMVIAHAEQAVMAYKGQEVFVKVRNPLEDDVREQGIYRHIVIDRESGNVYIHSDMVQDTRLIGQLKKGGGEV